MDNENIEFNKKLIDVLESINEILESIDINLARAARHLHDIRSLKKCDHMDGSTPGKKCD